MTRTPDQQHLVDHVLSNHQKLAERAVYFAKLQLEIAGNLGKSVRDLDEPVTANPFVGDLAHEDLFHAWVEGWNSKDATA